MRKMFTILAAVCCAMSMMAGEEEARLDSVYFYDNAPDNLTSRQVHSYDGKGNLVLLTVDEWISGAWVAYAKQEATFDENGNQLFVTASEYDGTKWTYKEKYEFKYNDALQQTENTHYQWGTTDWVLFTRYLYTYTANNQKATETFQQYVSGEWKDQSRHTYTYYTNGMVKSEVVENYKDGALVNYSKTYYEYNSALQQTLAEVSLWDATETDWVPYNKYMRSYTDGLLTLVHRQNYNKSKSAWIDDFKTSYSYTADGQVQEELTTSYLSSKWTNSNRYLYTYDAQGNKTRKGQQYWDAESGVWYDYAEETWLYELDGAKVTEAYSTYSQADKKWKFSYASTSFYTLPETGIVTVNGEGLTVKGRKIFRDGQVLIERGGVIYDLKGQVIK